jgi:ATP-binding cassette subfamily B protein
MADAGEIAFVVSALGMLDGYLRQIGSHVRSLQKAVNDAEELVELMDVTTEQEVMRNPASALPARAAALAFEHVDYGYEGAPTPLFTDLNISISAGQKVGLVGRSGSGKTTFVKLIQRIHEISDGSITLGGVDIASVPLAQLRRQIALVPQEPILFHRSLAENIAYARPGAKNEDVREAAAQAGAADFIERLPKGFGTEVGERGVKLSGGERQRVAIARAFLSDAPVLVMDEATSSLDSEAEARVAQAAESPQWAVHVRQMCAQRADAALYPRSPLSPDSKILQPAQMAASRDKADNCRDCAMTSARDEKRNFPMKMTSRVRAKSESN